MLAAWLAVLLVLAPSSDARAALVEGQAAPAFEVTLLAGQPLSLASLRGKVVLLHFWATWCPPCREEMPALQRFYETHRAEGIEIVAVTTEGDEDLPKVRAYAQGLTFPIATLAQSRVSGYGRIWAMPLSFLIDRQGILRKVDWTGAEKIDEARLERLILPLLRAGDQKAN